MIGELRERWRRFLYLGDELGLDMFHLFDLMGDRAEEKDLREVRDALKEEISEWCTAWIQRGHRPPATPAALAGTDRAPQRRKIDGIWRSRGRMSGAPCFDGTRVTVRALLLYLAEDACLETFLTQYPGVAREQCQLVLAALSEVLDEVAAFEDEAR